MAITIPELPVITDPNVGLGDTTMHSQAWSMLNAKYQDTWTIANWAQDVLNLALIDLSGTMGSAATQTQIEAAIAALALITVPAYEDLTVIAPSGSFSTGNTTLAALQARIAADITAFSTGLGATVEAAMMARETARVTAVTAKAYTEVTTIFSSRGFDMPPGSLASKQSEASAESALRLTDSSGKILEETTRLALDYNKHALTVAIQLQEVLARIFDSNESRIFEASKTTALLAVENYKASLLGVQTNADLLLKGADITIAQLNRQMLIEAETVKQVALGALQVIASAMNGVSASTSFGYGGSANTSYVGT